ncbi:MAG: hypothetical protein RL748_3601, partial [Pseudomonadota bacterium]
MSMAKRKPIIPRQERGTYRKGDHTVANPTNRTNQTNHIATGRLQNFTRVGLLVVLLGILAVLTLLLRLRMPPINTNPDPSLVALQPWFAGETITVPQQAGLWLQSSAHGVWLAKLARSMGRAQVIDLCTQRKQLAHDPMAIFEIRLAGGWQTMQQSTLPPSQWHQALILPNYASAGAPLLRIAGRAGNTEAETNLTMELAGPNPNWRLLTDKGLLGAADGAQFAFTGQAWLLWRKPDSRTPPEHFDYALHLVKRTGSGHPQPASTTCRAGSIEARFWQAADMAPGAVELEIWHQRSGWHSARLASGRHTIGDNRLEDQQLFDAAQQQGLIRLNQQGKVELAPSDLLLARRAGVAVPEWAQIDSNNEAVVRLHKRLYTRRDGEFVRAEIGRANASQLRRAACLLQPTLQRQACLQVEQDTFRHIHIRGKQLVWHSAPQAAQTGPLATVTIRARDGTVLYADGKVSERASALGLAPLFSTADGPGLGQSLAGSVGLAGARQADARLSIDPTWQALARQILHCDGALGGQWQIGSAQCAAPKPVPNAGSNENSNDMTDDAPAIPGR